jgi:hypothetical protein
MNRTGAGEPLATWKKALWVLLWCLPGMLIGWLVYLYGVDVPFLDQWDGTFPLFEKANAGSLGVSDFFAQHNEHRILVPRLIMFLLGKITRWNVRAELGVIWLLGWTCLLSFMRLAQVTGWGLFEARWLLFATAVFVFTPLGNENSLFGFQIGLLFPVACFVACLWIAISARFPLNFLFTIAVCSVCTFSIGSGFTCWLISFPLLLLPDLKLHWLQRRIWWMVWAAGLMVTTFIYFHGYSKPPNHPSTRLAFEHPLQAALFFLAYLGNPFAQGTVFDPILVAQITGFVLAAAFAVIAGCLWRWREDRGLLTRALPWVMCSFIAFINGMLLTVGRLGLGMNQAMPMRYLPFSTTLPISLLFLVPLMFHHWRTRAAKASQHVLRFGMGLSALAAILGTLHLMGAFACGGEWKGRYRIGLNAKAIVSLINVVDDPEAATGAVHPKTEIIKPRADVLNRLGYLRPPLVRSKAIREIANPAAATSNRYGEIQGSGKTPDGQFGIIGWAILPEKRRDADAVVLTYDDPSGEPLIFSLAMVGIPRTEVAAALKGPGYERCGWGKAFNPSGLPAGARLLRAWAYDAEEERAYSLKGVAEVLR